MCGVGWRRVSATLESLECREVPVCWACGKDYEPGHDQGKCMAEWAAELRALTDRAREAEADDVNTGA